MSLTSAAIRKPVSTIAATLGIVLLGSVSLGRMPVSLLPDVTLPVLTIRTLYPDAAATEVSRFIAEAITWIAATFDPEKIYLGGGVTRAGNTFIDSVRGRLREVAKNSSLAAQRIDPNAVTLAPIDGSTGPRGAAVLAQRAQANRVLTSFMPSKATSTPTDGGEI